MATYNKQPISKIEVGPLFVQPVQAGSVAFPHLHNRDNRRATSSACPG